MADRAPSTSRRDMLAGLTVTPLIAASPTGFAIGCGFIGLPSVRVRGPELIFVAQEWLANARALGMTFMVGSDGALMRSQPIYDGEARAAERGRIWMSLQARPRLKAAVYEVARRQFEAQLAGLI